MFEAGNMSETQPAEAKATIGVAGQEMEICEIPVDILVRLLAGLQQIIYLLATIQEKRSVGRRFRVPTEMQQSYSLRAYVPESGSYIIPLVLKSGIDIDIDSQPLSSNNYTAIMENLEGFFSSLNNFNFSQIQDIFPDSKLRNRALREIRKFLPKANELWELSFFRGDSNKRLILTNKIIERIDNWLTQDTPEDTVMTVTGELIRIDFDKQLVVLRYPSTRQEIECIYFEELEDLMIENRRQMIQVTGEFTLDAEGHPIKLTDVTRIEPVDLSPINIREVSEKDKKLRLKTSLLLTPKLDEETQQLFVVEEPHIGLYVFAYTRDELIHEINEQMIMMWDEYVKVDVQQLAPDALQLQERLLRRLEEV